MSKYLELFKESFNDSINEKTKLENKPYIGYSLTEGKLAYTVVPKPVAGPADNEIWYTTVDGLPIQYGKKGDNWNDSPQFSLFDFNACTDINGNQLTTLSNEYINGKGIIKLSGNIHTVSRFNFIDQHTITSVVLPKSAIILGDIDEEAMLMMNGPFYGCENLEEIIISQNTTHIGISALSGVKMSQFEIPDNTSLILALAFRGCDKLTSVVVPKNVGELMDLTHLNIVQI